MDIEKKIKWFKIALILGLLLVAINWGIWTAIGVIILGMIFLAL